MEKVMEEALGGVKTETIEKEFTGASMVEDMEWPWLMVALAKANEEAFCSIAMDLC